MTLEDALLADGQPVPETAPCASCGNPRPPFAIVRIEDIPEYPHEYACSTCYADAQRELIRLDEEANPPGVVLPPVRYSFNQWCDRFSDQTQVAMVAAAMTNPAAKLIYDRAMAADFIDPTDPRTIASMQAWVAMEVITQAEADAALAI